MSTVTFSTECPELKALIRKLDMFDDNINKSVRSAMHKGADIITNEQKRLISDKSLKLASSISQSLLYTTKNGAVCITTGYQKEAFGNDEDGFNAGVVGLTYEFGRPGKSTAHHRNSPTMKQIRRRIPNKDAKRSEQKKAVPTEVDIRKGTIQPHSHIRRGFDGKKKESARIVISVVENEVRKLGE